MILLINPPVIKGCEPPLGIARLAGCLEAHNIEYDLVDANIEGLLFLLSQQQEDSRGSALKQVQRLREVETYSHFKRYEYAVSNLNKQLKVIAAPYKALLSLANYSISGRLPQRSADLILEAANPENNPFFNYYKERFLPLLNQKNYQYIGISINYLNQALCAFSLAGFFKKFAPNIPLIAGGGLISAWMNCPGWNSPFSGIFEYCIKGFGEKPLLEIITRQTAGFNIHKFFTPSFKGLDLSVYLSPGFILPYNTSIGCYWNKCSYCPEKSEENKFSPAYFEMVYEDLKELSKPIKPYLIHFTDNALTPSFMKKIINKPPGIPWYGFARFDRALTDLSFCMDLKESGCVMLKLGLESGDQEVLVSIHKGISLDNASKILVNLKAAGIAAYVYLMFGTPAEDYMAAKRTLEFAASNSGLIGYLNLSIFNMPLYTRGGNSFIQKDFYEGDLSLFAAYTHPGEWTRKSVRHFIEKEFKQENVLKEIVQRNPPVFTSNHAPLFVLNNRRGKENNNESF